MSTMSFQEFKRSKYDKIEKMFTKEELVIQKRGQDAFIVLNLEHYEKLRTYELKNMIAEAKQDIKDKKYKVINDVKKYTSKLEAKISKKASHE